MLARRDQAGSHIFPPSRQCEKRRRNKMMMMMKKRRRKKKTFKTRLAVVKFFGWRYLAQQFKIPSESKTTAHHTQRDPSMHTHTHERTERELRLVHNLRICIITKHTTSQRWRKFWELLWKHLIQFSGGSYMLKRQSNVFIYTFYPFLSAYARSLDLWYTSRFRNRTNAQRMHFCTNSHTKLLAPHAEQINTWNETKKDRLPKHLEETRRPLATPNNIEKRSEGQRENVFLAAKFEFETF